ncbi:hypothetical protein MLD38_027208 [Melastoma candidum]|uniref:Uncharacterized protein n=1 Tax=Melastoma candidum TaxID=119954 RepID=A0ACB9P0V2_9MYRT|nr:hypothetical protein MLD38_027208 [Melastoma candidum]
MAWKEEIVMRDVSHAGILVSDRILREASSHIDLEEALESSRYVSNPYSPPLREWPPMVEVSNNWELPPVLIDRYNSAGGEGTAMCGIFPELSRAWASVDNSLFLWRFDKWDGNCLEFNVEEQAICAVGLSRSKPDIFIEAIRYLLVLATPAELILVGICCSGGVGGTDPYAEVTLQSLPEYTVATDGVTMTCITCTEKGRIFLAGRDGHIYEVLYTNGSGWKKHCSKVCLTAGFGSALSRWVLPNVFRFAAVDPIVEMVFDNERQMLYARTEDMKLQVFVLGANENGPLRKVAEERNIINQRDSLSGGRLATGQRTHRSPVPSIVCISPLSSVESKSLHLVAVLSDGRRMYLSTSTSGGNSGGVSGMAKISGSRHKPSCLKVVTSRPPPHGVSAGVSFGSLSGRPQSDELSPKVEAAYYSSATLVLSDSSPPSISSLLVVSKDSSAQSTSTTTVGTSLRSSRALRECASSLPVEGRMLFVADVLPLPDTAAIVLSLYSELEFSGSEISGESAEKISGKLWCRSDLTIQHIMPRRKIVLFSTMGLMEVVFNRPVDILKRLFESNSPISVLIEFFNRFGAGEAAAMCLLLAARIVQFDGMISNVVADKATEAFEDPRLVGGPKLPESTALSSTRSTTGGFSMGQVVQEVEPVFSGAHEGLCLCSSRLLYPLWELPVMVRKRGSYNSSNAPPEDGVIVCRLSVSAMRVLEDKLRSLEKFLATRRDSMKGVYGRGAGIGDWSGTILYGTGLGADERSPVINLLDSYSRHVESDGRVTGSKRQKAPNSSAELAAMEVRAMECIRQLLLRSSEALFLLQILSPYHMSRLIQGFDASFQQALLQLTFHQLVCSEDGDLIATRLISGFIKYYTAGPDGRGAVDDISVRLREGCPSYFKEADYKFFLAVELLARAAVTPDMEERDNLAREAFDILCKIPESADLPTVCNRFEELRFYEAVVRLPLEKARALDPANDALNDQIDPEIRKRAVSKRELCYDIIISALRSLKSEGSQKTHASPVRPAFTGHILDQASRRRYICQIVLLGVQSSDKLFHEYLYRGMISLGLEDELLEYGGPDLVPFLQNAARADIKEPISLVSQFGGPAKINPAKYYDLLARYYVSKRQHLLAAHILLRLAESGSANVGDVPTLNQRFQYLSNAVLQARSAGTCNGPPGNNQPFDSGLLDLLEGKLAVLRFQVKIKDELESIGSKVIAAESAADNDQATAEINEVNAAREKAKELSLDLKSITQLYNDYAVPFALWEICLEMLYFANYSGDPDSSVVRQIWTRLVEQAISRGGIAEACSVLKRVASQIYPGDGVVLPLDTPCLLLEKAALERLDSGVESVGDEDVARALLSACKGAIEPVLNGYDQLLSRGAILASPMLRLRLLRSILTVLCEWAISVLEKRTNRSIEGSSPLTFGVYSFEQKAAINMGLQDKITRYMTEVRRLPLSDSQTASVYLGFRELEESLTVSIPRG